MRQHWGIPFPWIAWRPGGEGGIEGSDGRRATAFFFFFFSPIFLPHAYLGGEETPLSPPPSLPPSAVRRRRGGRPPCHTHSPPPPGRGRPRGIRQKRLSCAEWSSLDLERKYPTVLCFGFQARAKDGLWVENAFVLAIPSSFSSSFAANSDNPFSMYTYLGEEKGGRMFVCTSSGSHSPPPPPNERPFVKQPKWAQ